MLVQVSVVRMEPHADVAILMNGVELAIAPKRRDAAASSPSKAIDTSHQAKIAHVLRILPSDSASLSAELDRKYPVIFMSTLDAAQFDWYETCIVQVEYLDLSTSSSESQQKVKTVVSFLESHHSIPKGHVHVSSILQCALQCKDFHRIRIAPLTTPFPTPPSNELLLILSQEVTNKQQLITSTKDRLKADNPASCSEILIFHGMKLDIEVPGADDAVTLEFPDSTTPKWAIYTPAILKSLKFTCLIKPSTSTVKNELEQSQRFVDNEAAFIEYPSIVEPCQEAILDAFCLQRLTQGGMQFLRARLFQIR